MIEIEKNFLAYWESCYMVKIFSFSVSVSLLLNTIY